jgi:predicted branched-subunit amino acid permease
MARGQQNPNPFQLIGIASMITLFFVVGVLGIVRGDVILAVVFLSIAIALVLFMIVVYLSARRRLHG